MSNSDLNRFYSNIFIWMFYGLMVTGIFSVGASSNRNLIDNIKGSDFILLFDVLFLLVIAVIIGYGIPSLSKVMAKLFFFAFSAFFGLTVSLFFEIIYSSNIGYVFIIAALGYIAVSQIYRLANRDLDGAVYWICYAVVVFPVNALITVLWFNEPFYWVVNMLILALIWAVLIIDLRFLKSLFPSLQFGLAKKSILGALILNTDIINIFFLIVGFTSRPDFEEED